MDTVDERLVAARRHRDAGRIDEAVAAYRALLSDRPKDLDALLELGRLMINAGDFGAAVECLRQADALSLPSAPLKVDLGVALENVGETGEAERRYREAIRIDPEYGLPYVNLGSILFNRDALEEAQAMFLEALEHDPDNPVIHMYIGFTHEDLGNGLSAIESFERCFELGGGDVTLRRQTGFHYQNLARIEDAIAQFSAAAEMSGSGGEGLSNMLFAQNFTDATPEKDVEDVARRYNAVITPSDAVAYDFSGLRETDGPLRVGWISGDFRRHAVSHFLLSVFQSIDARRVELYLYANTDAEDDRTLELEVCATKWTRVRDLGDDDLADRIHEDGIHILVDLSGHTAKKRLGVFARKPAPVQLSWLGYIGTTGVQAMDYILCDEWSVKAWDSQYFVEKPWPLPGSFMCWTPPTEEIAVEPPPIARNPAPTYGCFVDMARISDSTVDCWAEILRRVEGARLMLKSPRLDALEVSRYLHDRLVAHGLDAERFVLEGPSDMAGYLASYNRIDMVLNPFPYSGLTTAFESLWMSTPVLTLKGTRFTGRACGGILETLGLGRFVAEDKRDYVETAVAMAAERDLLVRLNGELRRTLLDSPLCDGPAFARKLEDAFEGMWAAWNARSGEDG